MVIATTRVVFIAASGKWRMAFAHTLTRARACNGARSTRAALAGGRARPFEALLGAAAPAGFCVEQEKCHSAFCSKQVLVAALLRAAVVVFWAVPFWVV